MMFISTLNMMIITKLLVWGRMNFRLFLIWAWAVAVAGLSIAILWQVFRFACAMVELAPVIVSHVGG